MSVCSFTIFLRLRAAFLCFLTKAFMNKHFKKNYYDVTLSLLICPHPQKGLNQFNPQKSMLIYASLSSSFRPNFEFLSVLCFIVSSKERQPVSSASSRDEEHGFELPQESTLESTGPCPSTLGRAHRMEALQPPVQAQRKEAIMEFCNPTQPHLLAPGAAPASVLEAVPLTCIGLG